MLTKPAVWYYGHLSPFIPQYHNLLMKYLNSHPHSTYTTLYNSYQQAWLLLTAV